MAVRSLSRSFRIGVALALAGASGMTLAQIEGAKGVAPIDSSGSFEVSGVQVDVAAGNAEDAREGGWRIAQRKAWSILSQRLTGRAGSLPDSALDAIVSGIIIENEQIGPKRYVARLGVLFNRERAASILGVAGNFTRSPPMLVLPLEWSGGTGEIFERATPWLRAWARFRTGNSAIDYVRLSGTGPDPLLLNEGQVGRRGRGWWRILLDLYGAKDILIPQVRLRRQWPGGPVIGEFRAGHGPDNREIARFTLRVENSDGIDALLDEGVRRMDQAYQAALRNGILRPDALLSYIPPSETPEAVEEQPGEGEELTLDLGTPGAAVTSVTVQYDTPNVASVGTTEGALRSIPGVRSATTSSLALGGVSLMRVDYAGDVTVLRAALEARGWQVQEGGGVLRIRRAPAPSATPPSSQTPTPGPAPQG